MGRGHFLAFEPRPQPRGEVLGTAPQAHEPRQRSAGHASHLDMVVQVQIHPATAAFSLKNRDSSLLGPHVQASKKFWLIKPARFCLCKAIKLMHFANPAKGIPRHLILCQDFSSVKTPVGGTADARRDRTCFSGEARLGSQFSIAAVGGCKLGAKSADAG